MSAEAVWWRCHRRIIADRAQLTSAAKLDSPEALIYPADASVGDAAKI